MKYSAELYSPPQRHYRGLDEPYAFHDRTITVTRWRIGHQSGTESGALEIVVVQRSTRIRPALG